MDGFSWVDCIITVEKKELWLDWMLLVAQEKKSQRISPHSVGFMQPLLNGQREIIQIFTAESRTTCEQTGCGTGPTLLLRQTIPVTRRALDGLSNWDV